jgi:hypothetical protein
MPPAALDDAVPPPLVVNKPSFDDAKVLALPPVALGDPAAPPVARV